MNKKNKKTKLSVKGVLASRGFYITLATLIIVFTAAAVVRKFTSDVQINNSSFDDVAWAEAVEEAEKEAEEISEEPVEEVYYEPEVIEEDFPEISQPTVAVSRELSQEEIIAELNMVLPLKGEIIREHSPKEHVYFKTMNDWRTHNGIDIGAELGTVVSAAADGVVEEVYEDNRLGIVVVVGHEGGIKTLYANLEDKGFIEVGRKVAKGDAVGAVGESSVIEGRDKSHIHFEIIKNEESQEPSLYIPQ